MFDFGARCSVEARADLLVFHPLQESKKELEDENKMQLKQGAFTKADAIQAKSRRFLIGVLLLTSTLYRRPLTANSSQVKTELLQELAEHCNQDVKNEASLQGKHEVKEEVGDEVAQDSKLKEGKEEVKPEVKEDLEGEGVHAEAVKEECREEVDEEVQIPAKEKVDEEMNEGVIQQAMLLEMRHKLYWGAQRFEFEGP